MESLRTLASPQSKQRIWITRTAQVAFTACTALFICAFTFLLTVRLFYIGRALPGVHAAGINLGGLKQDQIEAELRDVLTYPQTGLIVLRDGEKTWTASPSDLGVIIDIPAMARRALSVGREGSLADQFEEQIAAWRQSRKIPAIILFDHVVGGYYMNGISQEIELPTIEASLSIQGTEVVASPGQIGRQVDIKATLDALAGPVSNFHDSDLELVIKELPPKVLDASAQAEIANELLSQPLRLTAQDAGPWTFEPAALADMLRFEIVEDGDTATYALMLDGGEMTAFLEPLIPELDRDPENARFIFNDDTHELDLIAPAVTGRTLDVNASLASIHADINLGKHEAPLVFVYEDPQIGDDVTAEELGISELVSDESTNFSGSSSSRIQNIKTASSAFHGLLVAPGETLSMADVLGDISLDTGYAEALIIYGDRTIKGVGGGVCQVSTTLFRAVFFGGYPIVERHPHAYRVSYYEKGSPSRGPGLDATVFVPVVDFKFTNDSQYWLLMETYVYNYTLQWKFYSTSDGREVSWSRDISDEIDAPKDLYKLNKDLDKGDINQIDWSADGMTVVVYRTVTRNGELLHQDTIRTRYLPWQAVYEYGPGTKLPKDVIVEDEDD
ncbi:MAG: VanW family protein [Anaerolineales bacterium]|jgi:vancomycin resistance protein YoaR